MGTKIKIFFIIVSCLYGFVGCQNDSYWVDSLQFQSEFYKKFEVQNITTGCQTSIHNIVEELESQNLEKILRALKFFDSSGKFPNGILTYNFYDLGNYDECMSIYLDFEKEEVYGKYCIGTVSVTVSAQTFPLQMAFCLPHTCTNEDFQKLHPFGEYKPKYCYTKAETHELDGSDITAIVILSIFLLLVILSTGLDLTYQYYEREPGNKLLLAFSVWSNGKKILQTSTSSDQLSCINGIRALSMAWVIYGHVNSNFSGMSAIDNLMDTGKFLLDSKNMYLMAAPVSVDTFFAISGLLVVYVFLKSCHKGVKFNVLMFYVHRYLRLTPAVAVLVLFNATLVRYLGSGPFWNTIDGTITSCRDYWWSTLLYIQNYVNPDEMCSGQTWYLSVDMQLFVLTPLVLIPLQKWPKVGLCALIALIIAGILEPFLLTFEMNLPGSIADQTSDQMLNYMKYYYIQTYSRFGPYIIGMLAGYCLFKSQINSESVLNNIKKSNVMILFLWTVAIAGIVGCTYGGADILTMKTTDLVARSFYNALNRNAWAVAVCLVVILCCLDCGGPVNTLLSWSVFQVLSKLSYSMYLAHFTWVITVRLLSSKVIAHFDELNILHAFFGDFMITLLVSFVLSVVFESPMIIIEKAIFGDHRSKKMEKKTENLT